MNINASKGGGRERRRALKAEAQKHKWLDEEEKGDEPGYWVIISTLVGSWDLLLWRGRTIRLLNSEHFKGMVPKVQSQGLGEDVSSLLLGFDVNKLGVVSHADLF